MTTKGSDSTGTPSARFVGDIPQNYHKYLGPIMFEFTGADLARRAAQHLTSPGSVLELACGTGISTRHMASALPKGTQITATDLNSAMLAIAAQENGVLAGVNYAEADAQALDFDDDQFDLVVCQFGIMFFPEKLAAVKEMRRVLKPNGHLLLSVWDRMEVNPAIELADHVVQRFFESDPPTFLKGPFAFHDTDKIGALLREAGFQDAVFSIVQEDVPVADYEGPARGMYTGNPTILEVQSRGSVDIEEIIATLADEFEAKFGPLPGKFPFQAIMCEAV